MADMQKLMDIVGQLESNGIDVIRLLEGRSPIPMPRQVPQEGDMQPIPMPRSQGQTIDGLSPMPMPSVPFNGMDISGRTMPEFKPFAGPETGAVITDQDMEMIRRRMNRQNPMMGLLQLFGGR